jgi:hypothetical protein
MFIRKEQVNTIHSRSSKLGKDHNYVRTKTVLIFRCDNCEELFSRDAKHVDPRRSSNNFFHVCSNCDPKRFAQKKGVERRQVWDLHVSTNLPVGKH